METAEILFPYRELLTVSDLQEMDFGDFEGKDVYGLIDRVDYKLWLKGGLTERFTHSAVATLAGIFTIMLTCFGLPKLDRREIVCAPGEGFEIMVTAKMWQQSQAFEILGLTPYTKDEEDPFTE